MKTADLFPLKDAQYVQHMHIHTLTVKIILGDLWALQCSFILHLSSWVHVINQLTASSSPQFLSSPNIGMQFPFCFSFSRGSPHISSAHLWVLSVFSTQTTLFPMDVLPIHFVLITVWDSELGSLIVSFIFPDPLTMDIFSSLVLPQASCLRGLYRFSSFWDIKLSCSYTTAHFTCTLHDAPYKHNRKRFLNMWTHILKLLDLLHLDASELRDMYFDFLLTFKLFWSPHSSS